MCAFGVGISFYITTLLVLHLFLYVYFAGCSLMTVFPAGIQSHPSSL
jgi:hypothetical protein